MAEQLDLVAEFRTDTGKGSSRRLRHAGKVPAIIYGAGREPRALTFDHNELFKAADHESFFSSILTVKVGDKVRSAILKDIQVHPAKRQILHIDLQRVVDDEKIRMEVPLHYINEEICVGVKTGGGSVQKILSEVEITCFPKDLPEYIEVDIANLELDKLLHLSDIKLPPNVELIELIAEPPRDEAIVSVHVIRAAAEPEEEGEDVAEEPEDKADKAKADKSDKDEE